MFNKKTKELELRIRCLELILESTIKCEICGDKGEMKVCRKYGYSKGKLSPIDSVLCKKCLKKEAEAEAIKQKK